jgi:hypothetical protein
MKDTIAKEAAELEAAGFICTSSWVKEPHKPTTQMHELTHDEHLTYAVQDVRDITSAHAFVFHTDPTKTIVRGGRHVEFGIAVAMNDVPIYVVGMEEENIFHHLPQVTHFQTWEQVLAQLKLDRQVAYDDLPF